MYQVLISSAFLGLMTSAPAAQAPQTPAPMSSAPQSITMMGCVSPGATPSGPVTLSNAVQFGPMTVPEPSTVSPPPGASPTGVPGVTTGTAGTAGTTGTMTGGTPSTAGTAGTAAPGTSPVGTVGAVPGVPPTTYQLSGTFVSSYVGQNVQVTGVLVPTPNVAATAGAASSGVTRPAGGTDVVGTTQPTLPEFRVTKVEPLGIRCPQ